MESSLETFTYKASGDCPDQSRRPWHTSAGGRRPLAVWIHGGALIMGDRRSIDRALFGELIKAGYVVASIDYRLAPETKLPAILEDVKDAFGWLRTEGPKLGVVSIGSRSGRLGGRLSHADLRSPDRAAPGRAHFVLGIRRHRRPLVQPARRLLPPPAPRDRGPEPAAACVGTTAVAQPAARKQSRPLLFMLPAERPLAEGVAGHDPLTPSRRPSARSARSATCRPSTADPLDPWDQEHGRRPIGGRGPRAGPPRRTSRVYLVHRRRPGWETSTRASSAVSTSGRLAFCGATRRDGAARAMGQKCKLGGTLLICATTSTQKRWDSC